MAKLMLGLLFGALALTGADARAQCLKHDCSGDRGAWGAALGGAGAEQAAVKAAQAVVAAQQQEANAAHISSMGLVERRRLLYSLEDTLTRLSGKPATVVGATVLAKGGGYLFCVRIPRDRGHEFHGKVGADSTRRWARIPRDHGRPLI